jgi:CBS domain-containing protein
LNDYLIGDFVEGNRRISGYADKTDIFVREAMSYPVVATDENSDVRKVAQLMKKYDIDTVLINDREGRPVGIVTEGDIVRRLLSRRKSLLFTKAKHVMSSPVITANERESLEDSVKKMINNKINRLVVVNGDGKLTGILTQTDIIKNASYLIGLFKEIIDTGYAEEEQEIIK